MIRNNHDLNATLARIRRFQDQVQAEVLAYLSEHIEENEALTDVALTEIADELFCDLDSREAGG